MSVGYDAYKRLQALKQQEIEDYYTMHKDVLKPFLELQQEYQELSSKATTALLNFGDELMRTKKPRVYTESESKEMLNQFDALVNKDTSLKYRKGRK